VPERYLGRLATGQAVQVEVASAPDRTYAGEVTFVSPEVDVSSRAVTMKASVPNPDAELRAGQFANAVLVLEEQPDALIVPEAAIVPRGGENLVFVVRDGTARRREVRLGEREPGRVQILEGIAAGDTVVVAGQQRLADGTPVRTGTASAGSGGED
jgi:membrane fusion protein (multidrug efflux system)